MMIDSYDEEEDKNNDDDSDSDDDDYDHQVRFYHIKFIFFLD